ncbi:MAG TPA: right-handed parallel beta-helix repeat-containing protein [Candidatus Binatia bacterium]|nr:right-handed parallel beta-helix repeat-containing protein [Candidatus Binatia bacterium]
MRRLAVTGFVLGVALATYSAAHAATFVVNSTADAVDATPGDGSCATAAAACTLRAAVQEANALAGADDITLPAGTFRLTLVGAPEALAATGDLDVTQPLTITGATRDTTIIDGVGSDRVFEVAAATAMTMSKLTVRNGHTMDPGGGILHAGGAALTLTDVAFRGNTASVGGAVLMASGPITIADCAFDDNFATGTGGAVVHSPGSAQAFDLRRSTFTRNAAPAGVAGAVLYSGPGNVVVDACTFTGNRGQTGGSMTIIAADVTITGSTIDDSHATGGSVAGGAIVQATGSAVVRDTTVRRSVAEGGYGGMLITAGTGVTMTGCTFEDNQALGGAGFGGVNIMNTAGAVLVEDSTFRGNLAPLGLAGGFFAASGGSVSLARVVVEDNQAGTIAGGLFLSSAESIAITASRVIGNAASSGIAGGLFMTAGTTGTISDTTIADNITSGGPAGGAYATATTALTIERSTVADNVTVGAGSVGGGAFLAGATIDLRNSTISGNFAQTEGGGIYIAGGTATIDSCTFHGNETLGTSAAIYGAIAPTLRATVIGATATPSCGPLPPVSAGDNVDQDGSCVLGGPRDRSGIDPLLGPLADNGGPTFTHEPLAGSPLIDADGGTCLALDQRSIARPTDGDGDGTSACDIGAVEFVDECPTDPAKRLPGVCGCGVPDVDENTNGAVDCLINAELKARIVSSRTVLVSLTGEKSDAQTAAKAELTALADGLLAYCTANETTIVPTSPTVKLVKLAKKARKALRAARKGKGAALQKKQVRGGKALDALDGAVAPQA